MSEYTYKAVFAPDEDGGFVVTCPALPGLVTQGDTLEEARAMAAEAIGLYLESVLADTGNGCRSARRMSLAPSASR